MAAIAVHESVTRSRKLRALAKELNSSLAEALGILNILWLWGLENAEKDGFLRETDHSDLESAFAFDSRLTEATGKCLIDALLQTGWIDRDDRGFYIHDWQDWQKHLSAGKKTEPEAKAREKTDYTDGFSNFWKIYPRKVDKGMAYRKYLARRKDGYSDAELLMAAKNYAAECEKLHTEKQFIKHPKTFLGDSEPFAEYLQKEQAPVAESSNPFAAELEAWKTLDPDWYSRAKDA